MGSGLDLGWLDSELAATPFAGQVHHLAVTSSTNSLAIEAAQAGVATGVWIADEQTAGRGRGGHGWHSAAGDGLYVSVLVRPRLAGADALKLSLAAGLAAHDAARQAGFEIDLRWPNDLMIEDEAGVEKKFGGILTESTMKSDGALAYAVIGIGMNLNHVELPEDLRALATSLRMVRGEAVSRQAMLVHLLVALNAEVARLEGAAGNDLEARFARASTWVRGLRVRVEEGGGYTGVTEGLDPNGLLRVRLDDGTLRTVRHGGVRRDPLITLMP